MYNNLKSIDDLNQLFTSNYSFIYLVDLMMQKGEAKIYLREDRSCQNSDSLVTRVCTRRQK